MSSQLHSCFPLGAKRLNLLPWNQQLALGRAALGRFLLWTRRKLINLVATKRGLRITSSPGGWLLPCLRAHWVCVPCGCHGCGPRATPVTCCALLCFADPGDQSLWGHPLGGRRPGCWEGDVHKALSDVLLLCWFLLLARVSQPVTGPVLGTGCWGPCSDFPVLFPGVCWPRWLRRCRAWRAPGARGATVPACVWLG